MKTNDSTPNVPSPEPSLDRMVRPVRVQRKRTKGWRMPENTVCVDRTTKWGNPFVVGKHGTAAQCVEKFRRTLFVFRHGDSLDKFWLDSLTLDEISDLRGKNLACWCALDKPCHADVLLELANDSRPNDSSSPTIRAKEGDHV